MSPEEFRIPAPLQEDNSDKIDQQAAEAENGFNKTYGSLALAAALMAGFPSQAEAGGENTLRINSPEATRLVVELQKIGVDNVEFKQGTRLFISTDMGTIYLPKDNNNSPDVQVNKALKGVRGEQFLNEIQRQKSREGVTSEQIKTGHGEFKVTVSSYAKEAMKQMGITYNMGVLSKNGKGSVNLSGEGSENPNSECSISGTGVPFQNMIEAACKEIKIVNGRPQIEAITYHINSNLVPNQVVR